MLWTLEKIQQALSVVEASHEAKWIIQDFPQEKISDVINRRLAHEPLAYILGHWSFRNMELFVGKGVLIPRPETEELVDVVVKSVEKSLSTKNEISIADFGAGTGCLGIGVALELSKKFPDKSIHLYCVENSQDALFYLHKNVEEYFPRAKIFRGSWNDFSPDTSLDLIVSNPPYITQKEYSDLDVGVKDFEPLSALVPKDASANVDAMGPYLEIVEKAEKILNSNSWLWFEVGSAQIGKFPSNKNFSELEQVKDIAGKLRFFGLRKIYG